MVEIRAWEQYMPKYRKELLMDYMKVPIETGKFMDGELCRKLEKELKRLFNAKYVYVTGSGTDAYEMFLSMILNEDSRDDLAVVVPLYSFVSDWSVPASFRILTLTVDNPVIPIDLGEIKTMRRCLKERRLVAVPAWMHGYYSRRAEATVNAKVNFDYVINDFAHCLGSASLSGEYGFVSFAPTKIVGAGKGGAVLSNVYSDFDILRDFGRDSNGQVVFKFGKNFKMSEFDAAVILSGLSVLNEILEKQRRVFEYYNKELEPLEDEGLITCLDKTMSHEWNRNFYQFCVLLGDMLCGKRRLIEDRLLKEGIECWRKQNPQFHDRIFLPCHANLTEKDLEKVVDDFSKVIYEVIEGE
jgi:dTDP-4-amino-4,6-dideoxygalactose transaminase